MNLDYAVALSDKRPLPCEQPDWPLDYADHWLANYARDSTTQFDNRYAAQDDVAKRLALELDTRFPLRPLLRTIFAHRVPSYAAWGVGVEVPGSADPITLARSTPRLYFLTAEIIPWRHRNRKQAKLLRGYGTTRNHEGVAELCAEAKSLRITPLHAYMLICCGRIAAAADTFRTDQFSLYRQLSNT